MEVALIARKGAGFDGMVRAGVAPAGSLGARARCDSLHCPNPTEKPQNSAQHHQAGSQLGRTRGLNEPGGLH